MKFVQAAVWVLIILSLVLVNIDIDHSFDLAFTALKFCIEFFLLIIGAFQILKTTETNREQFQHTITFRKLSPRFYHLLWMGVVLVLADLVLIENYRNILSSDTILVAILFLYYFGQILYQNKPRILMSNEEMLFDDYFPRAWPWSTIKEIEVDDEMMVVTDIKGAFSIPLQGADELDPNQTKVELAAQVLDGSINFVDDASNFRSLLKESAERHGFPINLGEEAE